MRLNKAEPGGGGGKKGDLAVNQTDLSGVRDEASTLNTRLWKEARVAVPTSESAAGDLSTQGFELGGALRHVSDRWDVQLKSLMDACGHIANHVDLTKFLHNGDDQYVRSRVRRRRVLSVFPVQYRRLRTARSRGPGSVRLRQGQAERREAAVFTDGRGQ